jgi:hypothetical protein
MFFLSFSVSKLLLFVGTEQKNEERSWRKEERESQKYVVRIQYCTPHDRALTRRPILSIVCFCSIHSRVSFTLSLWPHLPSPRILHFTSH